MAELVQLCVLRVILEALQVAKACQSALYVILALIKPLLVRHRALFVLVVDFVPRLELWSPQYALQEAIVSKEALTQQFVPLVSIV